MIFKTIYSPKVAEKFSFEESDRKYSKWLFTKLDIMFTVYADGKVDIQAPDERLADNAVTWVEDMEQSIKGSEIFTGLIVEILKPCLYIHLDFLHGGYLWAPKLGIASAANAGDVKAGDLIKLMIDKTNSCSFPVNFSDDNDNENPNLLTDEPIPTSKSPEIKDGDINELIPKTEIHQTYCPKCSIISTVGNSHCVKCGDSMQPCARCDKCNSYLIPHDNGCRACAEYHRKIQFAHK